MFYTQSNEKIETISVDKQVSYVLTFHMVFLTFIGASIFAGITGTSNINVNGWVALATYIATILLHKCVAKVLSDYV